MPALRLMAENTYTVTLTNAVKDKNGQTLFGAPETWQFTTQLPTVQFNQAIYIVNENAGNALISVTLSQPSSQTVTVHYATSDGTTAHAPGDFTAQSGNLTFSPGVTTQTFLVPIIDNVIQDGNKTFNLTLSSPNRANLGAQTTAQVTITDNDTSTVMFNLASYVVDEGAGSVTITVNLTAPVAQQVTVDYAIMNGTAEAPGDYTSSTGTLTFAVSETTKTFQVPIIDDVLFELDETFHLTLSNPVNVVLGTPIDIALVMIDDNDPIPQVRFSTNINTVSENIGSADITVELSEPSGAISQVYYRTEDDTAIAGLDYTATSGMLIFVPGETNKTFSVPILDNALNQPSRNVKLILSSPSNIVLAAGSEASLTILDNNPLPIIQFSQVEYVGIESSGTVTITVTLNTPSGRSVEIDYATSDGSALAGKDYKAVTGHFDFLPGETAKTIDITLKPNSIPDQKRTFIVTLSNPIVVVLGTPSTAAVIINDGSKWIYLPSIPK